MNHHEKFQRADTRWNCVQRAFSVLGAAVKSGHDDDVEEVDADHTPTRAPPRSPAQAQVGDHRCAVGEHCVTKMTPLNEDHRHVCLNCDNKVHVASCGTL